MPETIVLGDIDVDVVLKDIKNVHLSVHPPSGRVRIAAPARMSIESIRLFAISKLGWIKQQQKKLQEQDRESPREFLERESHYVWGKRYLLTVEEVDRTPSIELEHKQLVLSIRPKTNEAKRLQIVEQWYREQVKATALPLVTKWEPRLQAKVAELLVRRMKTRWGSCNSKTGTIRLNTDLGKKPVECLEYILVHEMVHLLEPTHNERFQALMNQFMPDWKHRRQVLNRLPVRHEHWGY